MIHSVLFPYGETYEADNNLERSLAFHSPQRIFMQHHNM